ncbi:MAG: hypothetical protein ABIK28_24365 [Planctomycetota bacterium]
MQTRKIVGIVSLLVLSALACWPSANIPSASKTFPRPTEHRLSEDAESKNKALKRQYHENMHQAAPGIDWKSMEKQNGLEAMDRKRHRLEAILDGADRNTATWRELGSRNLAGRIHCAAWSTDKQYLYAGADRGGLWKGERNGTNWTPLGDNLYGGVHEVGIVPAEGGDPEIIIRLYEDSVHRSTDQGLTWFKPEGLTAVGNAKRIVVLDDTDQTVFVLFRNSSGQHRLKRSTDKGATFELSRNFTKNGDIWTPRTGLGPIYAVDGLNIYISSDAGLSWSVLGHPIPASGTGEAVLAGSETPDLRFNVAINVAGTWELWRSEDAAQTWSFERNLDDFWSSLVASSQDGGLIAYAGVEMFFSRYGGGIWQKVNNWGAYYNNPVNKLHADVPGIFALPDPDTPYGEIWYIGTDGGLYESVDQMHSVNNLSLSGLGVSQYYSVLTSRRRPDLVLAGSQDQGYQRADLDGPPPPVPGPWGDFEQLISGDYGHLTSGDGTHDLVYSVYPGFVLVQEGEEVPVLHFVDFPQNESYLWMPFVLGDPADTESFFFCASRLYRYTRQSGSVWTPVLHSDQDFTPGFLTALAFSPVNPMRAWAVTGNGRLFYSNDRAVTWHLSASSGPGTHYFYGTVLLPSSIDEDTCWVGGSGYGIAPVMRTTDGGVTWVDAKTGLPNTLVYCMAEAPDGSGAVFCGSENGAWKYDPGLGYWSDILGTEAPINTYWTCEAVPSQNLIRFGTYGRGIWDYSLNTPGYFPYGEMLGAPHLLDLKNQNPPIIGQPTRFTISGCRPDAAGVLALSLHQEAFPFLGGTLLVQWPFFLFPFVADGAGNAEVAFTMPGAQSLIGKELFYQAGAEDSTQVEGFALSHGLRAVIGD